MEIQPGTLQSVKSAAGDPVLRLLLLIKTGFSSHRGRKIEEKLKKQWSNYWLYNKSNGSLTALVKQAFFTFLDHGKK